MSKKKISSQDFLNLMDEQEVQPEKMAFSKKSKTTVKTTAKKYPKRLLGRFELTPMQEEWIKIAKAGTPQFVMTLISSSLAQKVIARVETKLSRFLR